MLDFIIWALVVGAVISFYLNHKSEVEDTKSKLDNIFGTGCGDTTSEEK